MEVKATNNDLYLPEKTREPKQVLDKDAFLRIMVEQLKNQDPTSPMDSDRFISQMAQFTSLEQMTNMNTQINNLLHSQQITQGSAMIGNVVTVFDGEELVTGAVDKVIVADDAVKVIVSGQPYDISSISAVEGKVATNQPADNTEEETVDNVEEVAAGGGEDGDQ